MSIIVPLNLDGSLPIPGWIGSLTSPDAGTVRYITAADTRGLDAMNRLQGDLVHRSTLVESKMNEMINQWNAAGGTGVPLIIDTSTFVLRDGSQALTGNLSCPNPVEDSHVANQGYVNTQDGVLINLIDQANTANANLEAQVPRITYTDWTSFNTVGKQVVNLVLDPPVVNAGRVLAIILLERANTGTELVPIYKYRQLVAGTSTGMTIDDFWLQDLNTVRVLVPNSSGNYPTTGYPNADHGFATAPRSLRAVVVEYRSDADPIINSSSDVIYLNVDGPSGVLVDGVDFGFWKPSRNVSLLGMQLAVRAPSSFGSVTVNITVDTVTVGTALVNATLDYQETIFPAPISVDRNAVVRFNVVEAGTSAEDLSGYLLYQPA